MSNVMNGIDFNTKSEKRCAVCGKLLKLRVWLIKEPQNIRKCYKCYEAKRYGPGIKSIRKCVMSHKAAVSV
jgi:transposase